MNMEKEKTLDYKKEAIKSLEEEKTLSEKIEKIWQETLMILANEDVVLDDIEDLKGVISVFIGRAIKEEEKDKKQFIKEILDEIKELRSIIGKKNYEDRMYNMGFENFRNRVEQIIKQKAEGLI